MTSPARPETTVGTVFRDVVLARQPIFDPAQQVVGYELLYRPPEPSAERAGAVDDSSATAPHTSSATAMVVIDGWLALGTERLTGGQRGFVNVNLGVVVSGHLAHLPADGLVLELGADVLPTTEVRAALGELRAAGYVLSLDGVRPDDPRRDLLDLVEIVKVDSTATIPSQRRGLAAASEASGHLLHVAKVETHEQFGEATMLGADLIQGYFFARPEPVKGRRSRGFSATQLQLLRAVATTEVDLEEIERLIRQDLTLAERFLRYVNSAAFGWRREITSLRHALVLLGASGLRSWISLLAMSTVLAHKPRALMLTAATRARFCESLGALAGLDDRAFELFVAGMFSVIDAALDMPLDRAIADLPLPAAARAALLGQPGPVTSVLESVIACERADWDEMHGALARLGVPDTAITAPYLDAMTWAGELVPAG